MQISGWQKTTLIDFPGNIATVLFTSGCNFRCPFCYNAELVRNEDPEQISLEEIFAHLKKRQGVLEGVVLCGGEPLLQPDLADFVKQVRDLGYKIKLDTNGYFFERLTGLIQSELLDYVALDIKGPFNKAYLKSCGLNEDWEKVVGSIEKSLNLLKESEVPYETRTTIVPLLHDKVVLSQMEKDLKGVSRWVWQSFVPGKCLDPSFNEIKPYSENELESLRKAIAPWAVVR